MSEEYNPNSNKVPNIPPTYYELLKDGKVLGNVRSPQAGRKVAEKLGITDYEIRIANLRKQMTSWDIAQAEHLLKQFMKPKTALDV